jgi:hypothetical protein
VSPGTVLAGTVLAGTVLAGTGPVLSSVLRIAHARRFSGVSPG